MAGFFILLLLLNGCSSLNQTSGILPPFLPASIELTQTPFFPQEQYQCGPAALATVLNYHQLEIAPNTLIPQVYVPARQGSLQIELAATARYYGMLAYPLEADLKNLLQEVAAGNPVLVLQNLSFSWLPKWHYAVVIGYDLSGDELILRSGTTRRWRTSLATFSKTWGRADNWALVILPPDKTPETAQLQAYLKAALDLEQTGSAKRSQAAYRAATKRWPDSAQAWLMLGNNAFALGETDSAYRAFRQAVSLDPNDPVIWNNLAYLYLAENCPEQANTAIEQALRLDSDDANLLDSRAEIRKKTAGLKQTGCRITPRGN